MCDACEVPCSKNMLGQKSLPMKWQPAVGVQDEATLRKLQYIKLKLGAFRLEQAYHMFRVGKCIVVPVEEGLPSDADDKKAVAAMMQILEVKMPGVEHILLDTFDVTAVMVDDMKRLFVQVQANLSDRCYSMVIELNQLMKPGVVNWSDADVPYFRLHQLFFVMLFTRLVFHAIRPYENLIWLHDAFFKCTCPREAEKNLDFQRIVADGMFIITELTRGMMKSYQEIILESGVGTPPTP